MFDKAYDRTLAAYRRRLAEKPAPKGGKRAVIVDKPVMESQALPAHIPTTFPVSMGGGAWINERKAAGWTRDGWT